MKRHKEVITMIGSDANNYPYVLSQGCRIACGTGKVLSMCVFI